MRNAKTGGPYTHIQHKTHRASKTFCISTQEYTSTAAVCPWRRQQRSNFTHTRAWDPVWRRRTPSILTHTQANKGCLPLPLSKKTMLPLQHMLCATTLSACVYRCQVKRQLGGHINRVRRLYGTGAKSLRTRRHVCLPACQQPRHQKCVVGGTLVTPTKMTPAHAHALRSPQLNTFTTRPAAAGPWSCPTPQPQSRRQGACQQPRKCLPNPDRYDLQTTPRQAPNQHTRAHIQTHTNAANLLTHSDTHRPAVCRPKNKGAARAGPFYSCANPAGTGSRAGMPGPGWVAKTVTDSAPEGAGVVLSR